MSTMKRLFSSLLVLVVAAVPAMAGGSDPKPANESAANAAAAAAPASPNPANPTRLIPTRLRAQVFMREMQQGIQMSRHCWECW
jgi:hypothetical protein